FVSSRRRHTISTRDLSADVCSSDLDAGIDAPGGYGAGLALAEICMGGVGDVAYAPVVIGDDTWPGVRVWTDHPAVSCMASQYARSEERRVGTGPTSQGG